MATITVDGLQKTYTKYAATFSTLPYLVMMEVLNNLKINLLQVDNEDVLFEFLRKSGLMKPYAAGQTVDYSELAKVRERKLEIKDAYAALKDHIQNMKAVNPLNKDFKAVNVTKTDPYEKEIIDAKIITFTEDVIDALFFSERNTADKTPMGCFNGYNYLIDAEIASGEIAVANGNYKTTGSLAAPGNGTDSTAYDNLVAWLRAADPILRKKESILYITTDTYFNVSDACKNKYGAKASDIDFEARLKADAKMPLLTIISEPCLGSGDRVVLTIPGNYDFGMNNEGDTQFVDIRTPYEDPNYVQFWMQAGFGCRIRSTHKKVFFVNEGTNVAVELSGDYVS